MCWRCENAVGGAGKWSPYRWSTVGASINKTRSAPRKYDVALRQHTLAPGQRWRYHWTMLEDVEHIESANELLCYAAGAQVQQMMTLNNLRQHQVGAYMGKSPPEFSKLLRNKG